MPDVDLIDQLEKKGYNKNLINQRFNYAPTLADKKTIFWQNYEAQPSQIINNNAQAIKSTWSKLSQKTSDILQDNLFNKIRILPPEQDQAIDGKTVSDRRRESLVTIWNDFIDHPYEHIPIPKQAAEIIKNGPKVFQFLHDFREWKINTKYQTRGAYSTEKYSTPNTDISKVNDELLMVTAADQSRGRYSKEQLDQKSIETELIMFFNDKKDRYSEKDLQRVISTFKDYCKRSAPEVTIDNSTSTEAKLPTPNINPPTTPEHQLIQQQKYESETVARGSFALMVTAVATFLVAANFPGLVEDKVEAKARQDKMYQELAEKTNMLTQNNPVLKQVRGQIKKTPFIGNQSRK